MYCYSLTEQKLYDDENNSHIIYGIEATDEFGNIVYRYSDMFFEKTRAERFAELCNHEKLDIIHLSDVIEDSVVEQYIVG